MLISKIISGGQTGVVRGVIEKVNGDAAERLARSV